MVPQTLDRDLHVRVTAADLDFLAGIAKRNEMAVGELVRIVMRGVDPELDLLAIAREHPDEMVCLSKGHFRLEERPRVVLEHGDVRNVG